jgi:hypothetical protein
MIQHRHPTPATQKHVLAASGNECAFPGCSRMIFDLTHETLIGTIAHIQSRCENGRRFDLIQSEDENRAFDNLVAMCAEHSKIIDGPKWPNFSLETLTMWKKEHEQRIANISDRNWIKPANSITILTSESVPLHFSYWVKRAGRPQLFNSDQLAVLNELMEVRSMILQLGNFPEKLAEAKCADVVTIFQQDWAKFKIETSVIADLCKLFAMAGDITFAEFLGFVVKGNDPTLLIQEGARRIERMTMGEEDSLARNWFKSNQLS